MMRIALRLREALKVTGKLKRGLINKIATKTNLERHKISALLKNEVEYVSLRTLGEICDYLVEHEGIDSHTLPGILFGREPDNFWSLLAQRKRLELCLGMRQMKGSDSLWIRECDINLQGCLLHSIAAQEGSHGRAASSRAAGEKQPAPVRQYLDPVLVLAPRPGDTRPQQLALKIYDDFVRSKGDRALLGLGSVKVDPVVEPMVASAFGVQPFVSEDKVPKARDRSCPFFIRYRDGDSQPESCCGGTRLSRSEAAKQPGIYFENEHGEWECCPCARGQDAALVFYVWRPNEPRLEMVLGGFSGLGTSLLTDLLRTNRANFWPPRYEDNELHIGVWVVKFQFNPKKPLDNLLGTKDLNPDIELKPIHESVIASRIQKIKNGNGMPANANPGSISERRSVT